jgi:hypothetical protein
MVTLVRHLEVTEMGAFLTPKPNSLVDCDCRHMKKLPMEGASNQICCTPPTVKSDIVLATKTGDSVQ